MNKEMDQCRQLFETRLRGGLEEGNVMSITFTKSDGTERTMRCCVRPDIVGDYYDYKGKSMVNETNVDHQRVWEIDLKQWRSFNYANVTEFEKIS